MSEADYASLITGRTQHPTRTTVETHLAFQALYGQPNVR
jgi:hypothetical protein